VPGVLGVNVNQPISLHSQNVYELRVKGEINLCWLTDFGEVDIQAENLVGGDQYTLSRVVTDQAGLVGLIRRLHGLGVILLSVRWAPEAD
jgi:hypothetical protein